MTRLSTKSLDQIAKKMESIDQDSLRYKILECAKNFKLSWIELGQSLYSVWKDKLYRDWGYMTFEAYTAKEIGIKKPTALKLLKSYYFLEKEEPVLLQRDRAESSDPARLPSYEAVNLLRLAKNKKMLHENDYGIIRKGVLEMGKDARDIKKDLTAIIRHREELGPEEARETRRISVVKRLLASLKALRTEIEAERMLPASMIKEISELIDRVEQEL